MLLGPEIGTMDGLVVLGNGVRSRKEGGVPSLHCELGAPTPTFGSDLEGCSRWLGLELAITQSHPPDHTCSICSLLERLPGTNGGRSG